MAAEEPMYISASDLRSTLTYQTLIHHLRKSLPNLTPDTFTSPHRQTHALDDSNSPTSSLLLMLAWSSSPSLPYIGVKLVTHFPTNSTCPGVHASYVLFSALDGRTLAVIQGTELTHWRTASVSALASLLLSRPTSETLLMVGAGFLAPHLIKAHLTIRQGLKKVIVWNRTEIKARDLVDKFNNGLEGFGGVVFQTCERLEDAVGMADIVCCATNSNVALVKGEKLKEGAHLDLVGSFTPAMAECDDEAVRRGRVFVDNEAALVEAGELVGAFERGVLSRDDVAGSLVQVIKGERVGRRNDEEITVFKSVGSAAVDVLSAQLVYESYLKKIKDSK